MARIARLVVDADDLEPGQHQVLIVPDDWNPEGLQGAPGEQGPPGPPGPAGQPRWTGHGPPGTIIGSQPGDHYLDVDSGLIYKLGEE